MKKKLFIFATLLVALGASSLVAANTDWEGKFWGDHEGIWAGTLYDDPLGPAAPHFEGKWSLGDDSEYGKLLADLTYEGHGIYKIIKGVAYDHKGNVVASWEGYFDVNYKPGRAEGKWAELEIDHTGEWYGQRILP